MATTEFKTVESLQMDEIIANHIGHLQDFFSEKYNGFPFNLIEKCDTNLKNYL